MRRILVVLGVALVVASVVAFTGAVGADAGDTGDAIDDGHEWLAAVGVGDGNGTDETGANGGGETGANGGGETGDGELNIHHLDVGQADSTLIVTPAGETILIDTGDWRQDGSGVIDYLEEQEIDRIDHLVATHAHADHIGGHAAVIEHFEENRGGIGAAYDSGVVADTNTYENYLDAIEAYGVTLFEVEEGDSLPIADDAVEATVLNPPAGDSGSDLHYNSVTLAIEFGEYRYLTTGDVESDGERRMVDEWASELDATIYQAGHHGSSTSSTDPFLDAVDPQVAVISSGYESQYGHPHDEVLETFDERGIETYWTGVHGDVVITTDGIDDTGVTVETTEEFSSDAIDLLEEKPNDDDAAAITPGTIHQAASPLPA